MLCEGAESSDEVSEMRFLLGTFNIVYPDTIVRSLALLVYEYGVLTDMGQGFALASALAVPPAIQACGSLCGLAIRRLELAGAALAASREAQFGGRTAHYRVTSCSRSVHSRRRTKAWVTGEPTLCGIARKIGAPYRSEAIEVRVRLRALVIGAAAAAWDNWP